jgi:hypothetical protein
MTFINNEKINEGMSAIGGQSTSYAVENGVTYAYHTFTRVGTHEFKVLSGSGYAKVLVVAGGGGGGMDMGGGGGGGGVLYTSYYLTASDTPISVTVGKGGWGGPQGGGGYRQDGVGPQPSVHQFTVGATNGDNSSFGTAIAIGGGYGGSSYFGYTPNNGYGNSGGSGGGASGYSDGNTGRNGSGTPGQGNNGGTCSGQYYSGGGGGAGGVGASGSNQPNGGAGILYSDMSPFYFGGGGGGASYSLGTGGNGGIGGGGGGGVGTTTGGAGINPGQPGGGGSPNSQTNTRGGDAGENTGGGGGGGAHYNATNRGGNGGSGIVIVKYALNRQDYRNNLSIIKNGLGLHLDATDPNSRIGSNNSWVDISNNGLNAAGSSNITGTSLLSNQTYNTASTSLLNTDTHTICFSFRMGAASGSWDKIFAFPSGGSDRSPGVWRYPSNRWLHWRYDPGNTGVNISSNATSYSTDPGGTEFSIDTWYYICVSKNGATTNVYLNGLKLSSGSTVATKSAGNTNIQLFNTSSSSNMQMRHVHIYNRVLSDQEVYQNYLTIASSLV